ncbi:hypothetical protein ACJX0J_016670, partial [Zea mays]
PVGTYILVFSTFMEEDDATTCIHEYMFDDGKFSGFWSPTYLSLIVYRLYHAFLLTQYMLLGIYLFFYYYIHFILRLLEEAAFSSPWIYIYKTREHQYKHGFMYMIYVDFHFFLLKWNCDQIITFTPKNNFKWLCY